MPLFLSNAENIARVGGTFEFEGSLPPAISMTRRLGHLRHVVLRVMMIFHERKRIINSTLN